MCYHIKFGSFQTKDIRINRKEPQNWGALGPRPLGRGVIPHINKPLRTCYHVKFGGFASKDVCINKRDPKTGSAGAPLAVGAWLTP